jgi:heat shock protein HslJ
VNIAAEKYFLADDEVESLLEEFINTLPTTLRNDFQIMCLIGCLSLLVIVLSRFYGIFLCAKYELFSLRNELCKEVNMFKKTCIISGVVFLMGLLMTFLSAESLAAETKDELYVVKGGVTYVLVKMSDSTDSPDSPKTYVASVEPGVFFESDGNKASLRFGKNKCSKYVLLRSTESDDEIVLTADDVNYRMRRVISASGAKFEAVGDPSTIFWSKGDNATIIIDGKHYSGYDMWLPYGGIWIPGEGVPVDVGWRVESIGGIDVIEGSNVTLTFGADGRLHGFASVNNYTAPWMTIGNRLMVSTAAVTRMMGSEELMRQEEIFLKALADVTYFKPLREGLALLTKSKGEIVLAR